MKKISMLVIACVIAMMANAVPAKRGWQTRTQADGTTIEVQQMGDEYYHYMINREGQQVREINGMYDRLSCSLDIRRSEPDFHCIIVILLFPHGKARTERRIIDGHPIQG
jgi:hypothetical protein